MVVYVGINEMPATTAGSLPAIGFKVAVGEGVEVEVCDWFTWTTR